MSITKHKKILKQTTNRHEYNVTLSRFRRGVVCPYCDPYQGCNGNGRFDLPSWKKRRLRNWKNQRIFQFKEKDS